jgi:hypothetical protein
LVLVRDVGLNVANGWTILLGLLGGAAARFGRAPIGLVLILVAMLPALRSLYAH